MAHEVLPVAMIILYIQIFNECCHFQTKEINVVKANEKEEVLSQEEVDESKDTLEVPKVQRSYFGIFIHIYIHIPLPRPPHSTDNFTLGGYIACCRCRGFLTGKRPTQPCFRHFSGQVFCLASEETLQALQNCPGSQLLFEVARSSWYVILIVRICQLNMIWCGLGSFE